MMAAGIAILFAKSRVDRDFIKRCSRVIRLPFFFVVFRAPDLALTQIVVETVTTALFLLCFYFLPEWKKEKSAPTIKSMSNGLLRFLLGAIVTVIALAVQGNKMFESISIYFENAYELSGWKKYCQYDFR